MKHSRNSIFRRRPAISDPTDPIDDLDAPHVFQDPHGLTEMEGRPDPVLDTQIEALLASEPASDAPLILENPEQFPEDTDEVPAAQRMDTPTIVVPTIDLPAGPPAMAAPSFPNAGPCLPQDAPQPEIAPSPKPRAPRVKTRLLGFQSEDLSSDPFAQAADPSASADTKFPVGWMAVVEGPGRGAWFTIGAGLSTIGRNSDQTVALDFGDASISRENHASIAFDEEAQKVFVGHGGKSNVVRLNDQPLLSTEALSHGDTLRIGKTTLRFIALCGPDFSWTSGEPDHVSDE